LQRIDGERITEKADEIERKAGENFEVSTQKPIIKKRKAALIFPRPAAELSTKKTDWHSFWTE
jgi:hypothetical protein